MALNHHKCAGCGLDLYGAPETGVSGLYNPSGDGRIILCIDCWEAEEALVEESGTNFHPDLLSRYYATFGQERPKLYDVIADAYV